MKAETQGPWGLSPCVQTGGWTLQLGIRNWALQKRNRKGRKEKKETPSWSCLKMGQTLYE